MSSARAEFRTATRSGAIVCALVALFAGSSSAAITEMSGDVELLSNAFIQAYIDNCPTCDGKFYASKATPGHEHDARASTVLMAFNERQNVTLTDAVNTSNPPYAQQVFPFPMGVGWQRPGPTIPSGRIVNSHYVWLNSPANVLSHDIATLKFDGPILGVIGKPADLIATNNSLGFNSSEPEHPFIEYTPTTTGFVNEDYPNNPTNPPNTPPYSGDIVIRGAPNTLTLDFASYAGDYVRIVTAADVPLHPGDFDHDYDVDEEDRSIWRSTFQLGTDFRADANVDGTVDTADYIIWRQNLGYAYSFPGAGVGSGSESQGSSSVPEPGIAVLLIASCLTTIVRRRNRAGLLRAAAAHP